MSWLTKLQTWFGTSAKIQTKARPSSPRARLDIELLEARTLMNNAPTLAAIPHQADRTRRFVAKLIFIVSSELRFTSNA